MSAPLIASADGKSVASSLEVYVFPAAGQTTEQQARAEQRSGFRKAFGASLEGKKYTVKF